MRIAYPGHGADKVFNKKFRVRIESKNKGLSLPR